MSRFQGKIEGMTVRDDRMKLKHRLENWLETRWVKPAYAGGLLLGLSVFFFASATNTMAGWLYVISGVSFALLGMAAVLPMRSISQLNVRRRPISPVSTGDELFIELEIANPLPHPKTLLQVRDILPEALGKPVREAISVIPPRGSYRWLYSQKADRRGIYRWDEVQLRTAAPLGLFWCRRSRQVPAKAIVYPTVLPLNRCPLIDALGQEHHPQFQSRDRQSYMATEGLTRSLRPYRSGDPIRLIHWRTSARYGDLRVRELEKFTSGQDLILCLDNAIDWEPNNFEQAAIAAASLYCYASKLQLDIRFWSASTGLITGYQVVLEALAGITFGVTPTAELPPSQPLIWLTQNRDRLNTLPDGSRYLLWQVSHPETRQNPPLNSQFQGIEINPDIPLQMQLQLGVVMGNW
ncbi:MAG: DUF58 domain-containing protein [Geitlerinemataceae cyanobacterium]